MSSDVTRTLVIDAAIVAVLVVLAFVLAPGVAMVGIAALVVLILGGISFLFSAVRARRRRNRLAARRVALAGRQPGYGPGRGAARRPDRGLPEVGPREEPAVRRVPASRRAQGPRKPLQ
jgi:hypothetical protein